MKLKEKLTIMECCKKMEKLIKGGYIWINEHNIRVRGYVTKGTKSIKTVQHVRKTNKKPTVDVGIANKTFGDDYDMGEFISVKYCPFCAKKLKIVKGK